MPFTPSQHESEPFLTPGAYRAKVERVEFTTANTGTQGAIMHIKTQGGAEGQARLWFSEKALWRLTAFGKACGLGDAELNRQWNSCNEFCQYLNGKYLMIIVADKCNSQSGKWYAEIVDFKPIADWSPELHAQCAIDGNKRPVRGSEQAHDPGAFDPQSQAGTTDATEDLPF